MMFFSCLAFLNIFDIHLLHGCTVGNFLNNYFLCSRCYRTTV